MSEAKKIRLALVVHNHQPVGNPDEIIERIYRTSYFPFIEKLAAFPDDQGKSSLHRISARMARKSSSGFHTSIAGVSCPRVKSRL